MNGPRRRLLTAAGSVAASLAGCAAFRPESRDHAPESLGREPGDPTTTAETTVSADYPSTVEANATIEREDIEYVEHNDTVRHVAGYESRYPDGKGSPPEREPVYEHLPFEEWAEAECASGGAQRVDESMDERLDGDIEGVAAGVTRTEDGRAVFVAHQTGSTATAT